MFIELFIYFHKNLYTWECIQRHSQIKPWNMHITIVVVWCRPYFVRLLCLGLHPYMSFNWIIGLQSWRTRNEFNTAACVARTMNTLK